MRYRLRISTFILLAAGSAAAVHAQTGAVAPAGALDGSFGGGTGLVTTLFNPASPINTDYAFDLVVQPDGKLVVAGWASDISDPADFALARYNPDGSLDPSFGGTGPSRFRRLLDRRELRAAARAQWRARGCQAAADSWDSMSFKQRECIAASSRWNS